ncbi:MAG: cupin domain-containing protein [Paludibacterium sp.]|uniref:cupin domain-containing protein n=1 Tax=Paludibacterium sp. TaxID=1917523 RepID=UPI0025E17157|nr:cupin domain-containing protein [Paludibacterium sp.]MBV8046188.1 cupin domain-containing protein [Paludibacterium sp.]MBV8649317.1 cupin domain-containing protein [Paludibacterium sp.]
MKPINLFDPAPGTFDTEAGIHIAALTVCDGLTFYLGEIAPGGSVNAHRHGQGDEVYLILSGNGCLYSQTSGEPAHCTLLESGDLVRIPSGVAHQLSNQDEAPLRLLFVCPDSHLGCDRALHADLQGAATS